MKLSFYKNVTRLRMIQARSVNRGLVANPLYKTSLGQKLGPECFSKIRGKFSFERSVEFLEVFYGVTSRFTIF